MIYKEYLIKVSLYLGRKLNPGEYPLYGKIWKLFSPEIIEEGINNSINRSTTNKFYYLMRACSSIANKNKVKNLLTSLERNINEK